MATHKHHIIPRHAGGSNESSNIVELTVEEHAEAHRILYENHGRWQDRIAWKALSGQITSDEARRQATRGTWLGRKHTDETKKKIKDAIKNSNYVRKSHTDETKKKISDSLMGHSFTDKTRQKMSESQRGREVSEKTREKISKANLGKILTPDHIEKLRAPKTEDHKLKISKGNLGKKRSDETKEKIRSSKTGTKATQEAKDNMSKAQKGREITWDLNNATPEANKKRSDSMKGRKKRIIECPHCNKSGGEPQMKQWHFDNCKEYVDACV